MRRFPVPWLGLTTATAVALIALAAAMPPDAFFSGDSGLKLIASLSAIAHPDRALEFDLPQIGGQPVTYVEHMISVHDQHAHVLQSPLFPALSAPFIYAFGLRGAYVLPLLSFVVLVPLLEVIRRLAAPETSPLLLGLIAVGANPVIFYALEYWEHAPAITLVAASVAAALAARSNSPAATRWTIASGALGGCAILLRPEAAWVLAGMLLIVDPRRWLLFGLAAIAVFVPFGLVNVLHSGNPLGPHTAQSLAPLTSDWVAARWSRIRAWLWPDSFALVGALLLMTAGWCGHAVAKTSRSAWRLVALVGAATVSVLAAQRWVERDSLWQAFPLVVLAFLPASSTMIQPRLFAVAATASVAILLTATHDGGAQWGPRFLLISSPILMVLAARGATDALAVGRYRAIRQLLITVVVVGGLLTTRAAYRELRGAKRDYARIVAATSTLTNPGGVIVTNVWWFDQINAALYGQRSFLFLPTAAAATAALAELETAHVEELTLVWTAEPDGESLANVTPGTCFRIDAVREVSPRALRYAHARCTR